MSKSNNIIFISCGQRTPEEVALGTQIQELVRELTPFEPYFAQYQTSLEGLSKNVFSALHGCAGFITVMHHRGTVNPPENHVRASVWVEQEIAIAAFIREALGKHLNVAAFAQKGIALEGVREQLLLNPKEFSTNEEALAHLRLVLPGWKSQNFQSDSLDLSLTYKRINITQERHDYKLIVSVTNRGKEKVDEYHVDLEFPRRVLPDQKYVHVVENRCTESHLFFRIPAPNQMEVIFPGDTKQLLGLDYFVDHQIFMHTLTLRLPVRATLYEKGSSPKIVEKSLSEFQVF